jgi:N-acetylneuraminic acid mutarotase
MKAAVLVLASGAVVAAACGESDDGGVVDAAAAVDGIAACPTGGPWADAPPVLLGPTQETAAVALDGRVHVIGGFNPELGVVRAVQIFDTGSCAWSLGPELPRPLHHANAAVVDGKVYVLGGLEGLSFEATGSVWVWDPAVPGEQWTERASMPPGTERGSAVVGVIDGTVILAGGFRGATAVADVSAYDPVMDRWDALVGLPRARDHACGGVVDGKLFVTGGRQGTIETIAGDVFEYAPGGDWIERTPMPTPRGGTGCGVIDDRIIVVGGEGNPDSPQQVFAEVEAYAPAEDSWESLTPMATPRHGMGAAAWDGRLYVPGGATTSGFAAVATHEVFTP